MSAHADSPLAIGLRSARSLAAPAAVLLGAGTALVVAYYRVPAVTSALTSVSEFRAECGPLFAPVATAILAGALPWVFRMFMASLRPERPVAELLFALGWWAFMGAVIDAFYRVLSLLFDDTGWSPAAIVFAKVLCDMLVFTPVFASPANALAHVWKDQGCSRRALREALREGWYRRLVLPNLVPNLMVWCPGVTLVYSMPQSLQLPTSNLIGCFWALMCIQIAANTRGRVAVIPEGVA